MNVRTLFLLVATIFCAGIASAKAQSLEGSWKFVKEKSTDIATWRSRLPQITVSRQGDRILIVHGWIERNQVAFADSFAFLPGGNPSDMVVRSPIWPENWFMGVLAKPGSTRSISGTWLDEGRACWVSVDQTVEISQGETVIRTTREYRIDHDTGLLTVTERRMSRPTPVVLIFERTENPVTPR